MLINIRQNIVTSSLPNIVCLQYRQWHFKYSFFSKKEICCHNVGIYMVLTVCHVNVPNLYTFCTNFNCFTKITLPKIDIFINRRGCYAFKIHLEQNWWHITLFLPYIWPNLSQVKKGRGWLMVFEVAGSWSLTLCLETLII